MLVLKGSVSFLLSLRVKNDFGLVLDLAFPDFFEDLIVYVLWGGSRMEAVSPLHSVIEGGELL